MLMNMAAIQCLPLRLQRYRRSIRSYGQFEDADEPGEQEGVSGHQRREGLCRLCVRQLIASLLLCQLHQLISVSGIAGWSQMESLELQGGKSYVCKIF